MKNNEKPNMNTTQIKPPMITTTITGKDIRMITRNQDLVDYNIITDYFNAVKSEDREGTQKILRESNMSKYVVDSKGNTIINDIISSVGITEEEKIKLLKIIDEVLKIDTPFILRPNKEKKAPIHYIAKYQYDKVYNYIKSLENVHIDYDVVDDVNKLPLHYVAEGYKVEDEEKYIGHIDKINATDKYRYGRILGIERIISNYENIKNIIYKEMTLQSIVSDSKVKDKILIDISNLDDTYTYNRTDKIYTKKTTAEDDIEYIPIGSDNNVQKVLTSLNDENIKSDIISKISILYSKHEGSQYLNITKLKNMINDKNIEDTDKDEELIYRYPINKILEWCKKKKLEYIDDEVKDNIYKTKPYKFVRELYEDILQHTSNRRIIDGYGKFYTDYLGDKITKQITNEPNEVTQAIKEQKKQEDIEKDINILKDNIKNYIEIELGSYRVNDMILNEIRGLIDYTIDKSKKYITEVIEHSKYYNKIMDQREYNLNEINNIEHRMNLVIDDITSEIKKYLMKANINIPMNNDIYEKIASTKLEQQEYESNNDKIKRYIIDTLNDDNVVMNMKYILSNMNVLNKECKNGLKNIELKNEITGDMSKVTIIQMIACILRNIKNVEFGKYDILQEIARDLKNNKAIELINKYIYSLKTIILPEIEDMNTNMLRSKLMMLNVVNKKLGDNNVEVINRILENGVFNNNMKVRQLLDKLNKIDMSELTENKKMKIKDILRIIFKEIDNDGIEVQIIEDDEHRIVLQLNGVDIVINEISLENVLNIMTLQDTDLYYDLLNISYTKRNFITENILDITGIGENIVTNNESATVSIDMYNDVMDYDITEQTIIINSNNRSLHIQEYIENKMGFDVRNITSYEYNSPIKFKSKINVVTLLNKRIEDVRKIGEDMEQNIDYQLKLSNIVDMEAIMRTTEEDIINIENTLYSTIKYKLISNPRAIELLDTIVTPHKFKFMKLYDLEIYDNEEIENTYMKYGQLGKILSNINKVRKLRMNNISKEEIITMKEYKEIMEQLDNINKERIKIDDIKKVLDNDPSIQYTKLLDDENIESLAKVIKEIIQKEFDNLLFKYSN